MNESEMLLVLSDIRNWLRAASYKHVKELLEEALPDVKLRSAYQMLDGTRSLDQVRIDRKMSPNAVVALAQKCVAMGLMEIKPDKKRVRLFDLSDFSMLPTAPNPTRKGGKK